MPRRARIHGVSLRSSLVNLPISIYGPLLESNTRPQSLGVHLTLVPSLSTPSVKTEAIVGWTGMASASSLRQLNLPSDLGMETIEIDPQYAQGLGFSEGDTVEIGLLHDLPPAKSVAAEPFAPDDWEIIEIHASHIESTLLSQVRVARIGQEIDIWVLARTRVRLRVVTLDPQSKHRTLLLATDTEVNIAPKLRRSLASHSVGMSPHASSNSGGPQPFLQLLRVIPARLVRRHLVPVQALFSKHTSQRRFAYLSPHTLAQLLNESGMTNSEGTSSERQCGSNEEPIQSRAYFKCSILRLAPPADPTTPSAAVPPQDPPSKNSNESSENPAGKKADANADDNELFVYVGSDSHIPPKHIAFFVPDDRDGKIKVDEWDIVRITLSSGKAVDHTIMPNLVGGDEGNSNIALVNGVISGGTTEHLPLPGVGDALKRCKAFCVHRFALHSTSSTVRGVPGLLVTGRSGAGKTSVVKTLAKMLQEDPFISAYTLYIDLMRHTDKAISVLKKLFGYWFDKASWHRPTLLVFDNMDSLFGVELEHAESFRTRQLTELFLSCYSSSATSFPRNGRGMILIGTSISQAALHPLLSTLHLFSDTVAVTPPGREARKEILAWIVAKRLAVSSAMKLEPDFTERMDYAVLASMTEGYSAVDLQNLVARAIQHAVMRVEATIGSSEPNVHPRPGMEVLLRLADFEAARVDFVPHSLRDVKLQKSEVAWSNIGGLHEAKKVLQETLEWPTKYGPIFKQSPLRLRSGLLIYGFPGCGKTLLASAIAKECGLNFIGIKGPEILNKYIGASEQAVRDLFERASAARPCVLFFDEFDAIAPKRGHDSTGVTDRVVNQLLTQMDGAESLEGVYVLAATSRPDLIDSALLRPGRLDKSLFCGMPDIEERKEILQSIAQTVMISPSADFEVIAQMTEGFSGADLQALIYNAYLEAIHSSIGKDLSVKKAKDTGDIAQVQYTIYGHSTKNSMSKADEASLQQRLQQVHIKHSTSVMNRTPLAHQRMHEILPKHISHVLQSTQPSVSPIEYERLYRIYSAFVSDRTGDFSIPPNDSGIGNRVSLM